MINYLKDFTLNNRMKQESGKEMNDTYDTFFIENIKNIENNNTDNKKNKDEVFEAQFTLAMIQAGYDSLNDITINNIKEILDSPEYSSDYRLNKLKSDFEKTIKIWGYSDEIDSEELLDLYYKIESLKQRREMGEKDDLNFMFIKTLQRALRIKKIIETMKPHIYERYKKYYGYFEYIIKWIYEVKKEYV